MNNGLTIMDNIDQQGNRTGNILPRRGLAEENCRRFEQKIAEACKGSVEVDPSEQKLTARSYIVYWSEARRGFKMYGYGSRLIPQGYATEKIKPRELDNGKVLLQNLFQDRVNTDNKSREKEREMNFTNKEKIEEVVNKLLIEKVNSEPIRIQCNNESQMHTLYERLYERLKELQPGVSVMRKPEEMVVVIL